jgi:hypothetical protein
MTGTFYNFWECFCQWSTRDYIEAGGLKKLDQITKTIQDEIIEKAITDFLLLCAGYRLMSNKIDIHRDLKHRISHQKEKKK